MRGALKFIDDRGDEITLLGRLCELERSCGESQKIGHWSGRCAPLSGLVLCRLGCPGHHGHRRSRPVATVAGKTRRGRTRGPVAQSYRPARASHRGAERAFPIQIVQTRRFARSASNNPIGWPWRSRTLVSLCPAIERARHRAQDLEPATQLVRRRPSLNRLK